MGALILAESLAAQNPLDLEVHRCIEDCRRAHRDVHRQARRAGSRAARLDGRDQLQNMALDHRAGFLISCIDGASSLDEVLDMSGMPAARHGAALYELVQRARS